MKRSRWLQVFLASALVCGSVFLGAGTSLAAGTLSFVGPGPQDAGKAPAVITTGDFDTSAPAVQVAISGGSATATVTLEIDASSPDADPTAALNGNVARARQGVATFTNLSITKHGTYVLKATASNMSPDFSGEFRIWDAVCKNGSSCSAGQVVKNSQAAGDQQSVSTNAPTGQTVALSLGDEDIDCSAVESDFGVTANHAPLTTSLFATDDSEKLVTIIVSSFYDTNFGDPPGAAFYEVCYVDERNPWTDKFDRTIQPDTDGTITADEISLLPDCSPSQGAPCVVSRTKESKSRNVKIVVRLLDAKCR